MNEVAVNETAVLTPADLLVSWQGHRRLTRRIIDAFPEDQLFSFTLGGMRPFGGMAWELCAVSDYMLDGLMTDTWAAPNWNAHPPQEKAALLAAWDDLTRRMDTGLPAVPATRYHEDKALFWGTMPAHAAALYAVDNEIHHRGQGYVYLRALGVEPVPFWER
ncbi:DinB family protein [Deinococcus sp.]|uniref:DinB family protein n=1 Tax=Deinococcus sp. TaxID=47478 RepID=UPI003C7E14E7